MSPPTIISAQKRFRSVQDAFDAAALAGWTRINDHEVRYGTRFMSLIDYIDEHGNPYWKWIWV